MTLDTADAVDAALTPRLARFVSRSAATVDRALDRILPASDKPPTSLHAAMRYAVFPGGKRIRPALTALAYRAAGGRGGGATVAGCAIELVHSFSLIHDDLPCMDDSPTRRGKASVHCRFDEATALLAGDALFSLTFEILARPPAAWPNGAGQAIALIVAQAAGAAGMIGGQAADPRWRLSRGCSR
jgi:geranylgeranyl pyrophosphate synthase